MFNKEVFSVIFSTDWYFFINYRFIVSILNWLYYNYFYQTRSEITLTFENLNLLKEFYFIASWIQLKLEKSYLNYDLNRFGVFNFWAEEYFVTQTPLTIHT
jgi:hypothetical protein